MKKIIIMSIFVLLLIFCLLFYKKYNKKEIKDIKYFKFSQVNGYSMYYDKIYKIENNTLYIRLEGMKEEYEIINLGEKDIVKLENLINKFNIYSWNGFRKYNKNVYDGTSFNLYIRYGNDKTVEANGYMKWPKNYGVFRDELINLFDSIKQKNKSI